MASSVKYFNYFCTRIYLLKIHNFKMFVFVSFISTLLNLFYSTSVSMFSIMLSVLILDCFLFSHCWSNGAGLVSLAKSGNKA